MSGRVHRSSVRSRGLSVADRRTRTGLESFGVPRAQFVHQHARPAHSGTRGSALWRLRRWGDECSLRASPQSACASWRVPPQPPWWVRKRMPSTLGKTRSGVSLGRVGRVISVATDLALDELARPEGDSCCGNCRSPVLLRVPPSCVRRCGFRRRREEARASSCVFLPGRRLGGSH